MIPAPLNEFVANAIGWIAAERGIHFEEAAKQIVEKIKSGPPFVCPLRPRFPVRTVAKLSDGPFSEIRHVVQLKEKHEQ